MSKIVFPGKLQRKPAWLVDFAGGLIRGMLTVGASGVLTAFTLLWMKANGYLLG